METVSKENKGVGGLAPEGQAEMEQHLNVLWSANRTMLLQRVDMLEREFWRLLRSPEDRAAALIVRDLAHKIARVLETFGMVRGSRIATTLERISQAPRGARGTAPSTVYGLLHDLRTVVRSRR